MPRLDPMPIWVEDPTPRNRTNRKGLFGSGPTGGLLGSYVLDPRASEQAAIDAISSEVVREAALHAHSVLKRLDAKINAARQAWVETLEPYWQTEREGREWNKERQRRNAKAALERGEPADFYQVEGIDPWRNEG